VAFTPVYLGEFSRVLFLANKQTDAALEGSVASRRKGALSSTGN